MSTINTTEIYYVEIAPNPGLRIGPEIVFTKTALMDMLDFIVDQEPECGGIGTGPINRSGINRFIPDPVGSKLASHTSKNWFPTKSCILPKALSCKKESTNK